MNESHVVVPGEYLTSLKLSESRIDILPQLYRMDYATSYDVYPIETENYVIIIPEALPYSEFSAYLRTVISDPFFGYSSIAIVVVMLLLIIFR